MDTIGFLETLGRNPAFPQASDRTWDALGGLAIGEQQRRALLDGDAGTLSTLLGGRAFMAMHILVPDDGEQPCKDAPGDGEDDLPGEEDPGEGKPD